MDIKYLGHSSFRIKGKQAVVITDPFDSKIVGVSFPKQSADVITVSHDHKDHNCISNVLENEEGKKPVVLRGPGEYEVKGVKIFGYSTFHDSTNGSERGKNTMYLISIDGINILHCGDLGHQISDKLLEELDEVHVLIIPTGGVFTINEKDAEKITRQIEPNIVIPMHYNFPKIEKGFSQLSGVDVFLKELGKTPTPQPKLTVTHDKLPQELEVVVLTS